MFNRLDLDVAVGRNVKRGDLVELVLSDADHAAGLHVQYVFSDKDGGNGCDVWEIDTSSLAIVIYVNQYDLLVMVCGVPTVVGWTLSRLWEVV